MYKYLAILLILAVSSLSATISIGNSVYTNSVVPINSNYENNYTQQLYYQSEILGSGLITGIKINYSGNPGTIFIEKSSDWMVFLGHTTKSIFANNNDWVSPATLTPVWSGQLASANFDGQWLTINFTTPFYYNNIDNLVLAVYENTPGETPAALLWFTSSYTTSRSLYVLTYDLISDPYNPPSGTGISGMNNIQLLGISYADPATPPTDPFPANLAVNVNNPTTLSWTGNGDYYDLYVKRQDEYTFAKIGSNLTTASYTYPAYNYYGTEYSWYVVCKKATGLTATGPTWQFTTKSGNAANPLPANNATGVGVFSRTLDWADVPGAIGYKITIGTTPHGHDLVNGEYLGNQTSYNYTSNWAYNSQYYWYVTVITNLQFIFGDTWSFMTQVDQNSGGGDNSSSYGGYYFANNISTSPNHPAFLWVENAGAQYLTSTVTNGDINDPNYPHAGTTDNGYWGPIDLGFNFTFYGNTYNQCYISTNGVISFGQGTIDYNNAMLPNTSTPNNIIAPFWDNMEFYPGHTSITFQNMGSAFVVTWYQLGFGGYSFSNYVTFQAILYPNNCIKFQYKEKSPYASTSYCTVGIENAPGTQGVTYLIDGVGGNIFPPAKSGEIAIIFGNDTATLPVTLSYFKADFVSYDNNVQLKWKLESADALLGFNLYRSENNMFSQAGRINTSLITECITEGTSRTYSRQDSEISENSTYYYWLESIELDNTISMYGPVMVNTTQTDPNGPGEIKETNLHNAYPNPFNPSTTISYSVKESGMVLLDVFNSKGEKVKSLVNNVLNPGNYTAKWDGRADNGKSLPSGIYFYRMQTPAYSTVKKMLMVK